jgi:hypothetical protein
MHESQKGLWLSPRAGQGRLLQVAASCIATRSLAHHEPHVRVGSTLDHVKLIRIHSCQPDSAVPTLARLWPPRHTCCSGTQVMPKHGNIHQTWPCRSAQAHAPKCSICRHQPTLQDTHAPQWASCKSCQKHIPGSCSKHTCLWIEHASPFHKVSSGFQVTRGGCKCSPCRPTVP